MERRCFLSHLSKLSVQQILWDPGSRSRVIAARWPLGEWTGRRFVSSASCFALEGRIRHAQAFSVVGGSSPWGGQHSATEAVAQLVRETEALCPPVETKTCIAAALG